MTRHDPAQGAAETRYFTVWRWHFYASLHVIPFLVMLALTGLVMMWTAFLAGTEGERLRVPPQAEALAPSTLQMAAETAFAEATAKAYLSPLGPDRVALVRVGTPQGDRTVALDPYTASVLRVTDPERGLYPLANRIHGTLLLGDAGDRLIEVAASLGLVVLVSGLWLHWPRGGGWRQALLPRLRSGRGLWKSLHGAVGLWVAGLAVVFLISGLAWTGVWGGQMVQAWSSFPAEKWDKVPLSDQSHASLNPAGGKEVPWALEQTPLPASGSGAGAPGVDLPDLDSIAAFAARQGFAGRFQIAFPAGETGVWTISHDTMSNDGTDATADRTIHIDRFSGRVLADVGFADYGPMARAMAAGVAFHEGDLGLWNLALNSLFCLAMIFLPLSGLVMWWKRRPQGARRLSAPPAPVGRGFWWSGAALVVLLGLAFPLGGAAMLAVVLLDRALLRLVPDLHRALS